jgi:signal recognition particle GTPase
MKRGVCMNMQKNVIKRFKSKYPDLTLKETSSLTGIQMTRIFRIFNGHEMKVSEYEKFQEVIHQSEEVYEASNEFLTELFNNITKLSRNSVIDINNYVNRKVHIKELIQ